MEILEINFKSVFETSPGKNVLLLPDTPYFTVAALSDSSTKAAQITREEAVGRSIFDLYKGKGLHTFERIAGSLSDSLHHVLIYKQPHSTDVRLISEKKDIANDVRRFLNKPVLSDDGEVLYIVHHVRDIKTSQTKNEAGQVSCLPEGIENESTVANMITQAPVAMAVLRGEDMILEMANPQMLDIWGRTSEIIGMPIVRGLPEIIDQQFPDLLKNVYRTGLEYHGFETQAFLTRQGVLTECFFNFVYTPLKNSRGESSGIIVIAAEVTNLVKAKKELQESEKRYRDLIDNATVATSVYIGEKMEIRLANEAMLKLWGKDSSVIGKPLKEAIPELDGQPFHELLERVYKTGSTYHSSEGRADLVVNGRLQSFYFNFTYKALRDSSGSIYGILNMAVDVTETVKAKMKINEAEERWRIALNAAELGTFDYYPLTKKFYCSTRTKELFGLPENADPIFEKMLEAVHPKDRESVSQQVSKALNVDSAGNYRVEYEVTGIEDKKERWLRASGHAFFNEHGIAYRLTGTILDITERKKVEEALEERVQLRTSELMDANRDLERSNYELEQYAYVASHDLQEPLRKIMVYTDLLTQSFATHSSSERVRLEKIISSALRMSHLIQDLLNFSRLLKTEKVFSKVDLNRIVSNVVDDFELTIEETGARIDADLLPVIEASPQQMNQLFYNLISNALKFRQENRTPHITISGNVMTRKEVESFSYLTKGLKYYNIRVRDNGIGFNPRYATHIFEIFKRLHTRAKYEGTGIGLALCRKIARNHRGDIYAESKEGMGSEFNVLLPLKQNS